MFDCCLSKLLKEVPEVFNPNVMYKVKNVKKNCNNNNFFNNNNNSALN